MSSEEALIATFYQSDPLLFSQLLEKSLLRNDQIKTMMVLQV